MASEHKLIQAMDRIGALRRRHQEAADRVDYSWLPEEAKAYLHGLIGDTLDALEEVHALIVGNIDDEYRNANNRLGGILSALANRAGAETDGDEHDEEGN